MGGPVSGARARRSRRESVAASLERVPPWAVAALTLLAATLFVLARWQLAADGDLARFVLAGSLLTSPEAGIPVLAGPGYDGQFSYRLAVDPTDLRPEAQGVTLDAALRLQRITYPALAFVVSLGQEAWVPAALVAVNVLGLAAVALLAALLARDAGRAPLWGLLAAGFFGFVITLARDLTEITTAALLLGGVLAWQRGRRGLASGAFSAAALSRESALLFVGVFLLAEVVQAWRRGERAPGAMLRLLGLAAAPLLAFCAWQAVAWQAIGVVPVLASGGRNLVLPGQDLAPAAVGWVRGAAALEPADLVNLGQFVCLLVVVGLAGLALRRSAATVGLKAAWLAALLLVVSLSASVWRGPADFRTSTELYVASVVLLLGSRRPLHVPALLLAVATPLTALLRVVDL